MSTDAQNSNRGKKAAHIFREAEVKAAIETIDKATGRVKYGQDDLFPQYLYSLYYQSPIHGGIINQKVQFIVGDGVEVTGALAPRAEEILDNGFSKSNLDEVISETALDLEVLAYFYLHFRKQPDGRWIVEPLSGELMRPNENLTQFFYSEDWKSRQQSPEKTGYKTYKSIFYADLEKDTECVMYVKLPSKQTLLENGKLTSSVFPIQPYFGALPSILADIEMNHFHYSEVVNGWTSNTILNLNDGIPEEHEKKRILKEIRQQTTDRTLKGGMTVFFNDGKERAATIENIGGNNNDTRYLLTQEHGIQTIMIGHSVQNTALFGLEVAGKLGGTAEIPQAFKRFMGTYVRGKRNIITEAISFGLEKLNNWEGLEITFRDWRPDWLEVEAPAQEAPVTPEGDFNDEGKKDPVLEALSKVGRSAKGLKIVSSKAFDMKSTDESFISEYLSEGFAVDLTEDQTRILHMIAKKESYKAIVDAIGKGATYVSRQLIDLTRKGLVENWELTREGNQATATAETLTVLYTYERRPDVDGPDVLPDGRTRPFCETLIGANKAYTRQEIDQISAAIGRDVWLYRGGWYSNPKTGKNQPSCRHFWKQNIVIS